MYCKFCNNILDAMADGAGFIVCPYCRRVNIVAAPQPPINYSQNSFSSQPPPKFLDKFRLSRVKPNRAILAAAVIAVIGLGLFGLQRNIFAQSQLESAVASDKIGDYARAAAALKKAQSLFVLSSIKTKASTEAAKNQRWLVYHDYQTKAEQLIKDQKYTDALALLQKVSKDFPTYQTVSLDIQKANQALTVAAQAIKAAQPASKVLAPTKTATPKAASPPIQIGCFPPSSINGKRFGDASTFSSVLGAASISQVQQIMQSFFSQYGLGIEITSVSPSLYVQTYATYDLVDSSNLCQLKAYSAILVDEWSKYPVDWVKNSNVKDIILVKDLQVTGQKRAAMPDSGGMDMYYDPTYSGDYAREVIHHEYDHLITYGYFGSFSASDPTWQSYNPSGFSYGNGGASCYVKLGSCPSTLHPVPGFVDFYATTAIEEDQAELYAYLMTSFYYQQLKGWLASDSNLSSKVSNYKQFIASHSPAMSGSYFDQINP